MATLYAYSPGGQFAKIRLHPGNSGGGARLEVWVDPTVFAQWWGDDAAAGLDGGSARFRRSLGAASDVAGDGEEDDEEEENPFAAVCEAGGEEENPFATT